MFVFGKICRAFFSWNTRTCAYQGVRNICFSENLACFAFLKHPFWDSPFCLINDNKYFNLGRKTSRLNKLSLYNNERRFCTFNILKKQPTRAAWKKILPNKLIHSSKRTRLLKIISTTEIFWESCQQYYNVFKTFPKT